MTVQRFKQVRQPVSSDSQLSQPSQPPHNLQPGDHVYVRDESAGESSSALHRHWDGPFLVLATSPHTVTIDVQTRSRANKVHIRNVKKANVTAQDLAATQNHQRRSKTPTIQLESLPLEDGEFIVERIVDERQKKRTREFLVQWKGFPQSMNTWEPARNLINARGAKTLALIKWERQRSKR